MQQTDKYKFNLIDAGDAFSPEPLNRNMEAVEAQLARVDAALDAKAPQTDLDALGQGQLVYKLDTYIGTGESGSTKKNRLEFDFKPLAVVVGSKGLYGGCFWLNGQSTGRSYVSTTTSAQTVYLSWEDKALEWYSSLYTGYQLNEEGTTYYYFALGVRE